VCILKKKQQKTAENIKSSNLSSE